MVQILVLLVIITVHNVLVRLLIAVRALLAIMLLDHMLVCTVLLLDVRLVTRQPMIACPASLGSISKL